MNLIDEDQALKDLQTLKADYTSTELVLNNIRLLNQLLTDQAKGGKATHLYLTYQLNVQICKQLNDMKRRIKAKERKEGDGDDPIEDLIKSLQDIKTVLPGKGKKEKA